MSPNHWMTIPGIVLFMGIWCELSNGRAQDRGNDTIYPSHPMVVDVTAAPYFAKGDGQTDDTAALQQAFNENVGHHRVLFFPKGTYMVSATLTWPKKFAGHDNWGKTMVRGANKNACSLRLKDETFVDTAKPSAIMWCGGFGSADWFHNHIENLTFDVGRGNPAAIGLQFYSNNTGAVRDCRFVASDESGLIGLDLGHRDMNGPMLVKDCEVIGFARGIATSHAVNSQTFENITLRQQRQFGFTNEGQSISIRNLKSENTVPAISTYGRLLLINARITGRGAAANAPALLNYNSGRAFFRDVKTTGYKRALADLQTPDSAVAYRLEGPDKPGSLGPDLPEYSSHETSTAFPSPTESLRLPVKETPIAEWEAPDRWAVVSLHPDDPDGKRDYADAIQNAIDSGATTIFLPHHYTTKRTISIRGNARRIIGISGFFNYGQRSRPDFRVEDGAAPIVWIENFAGLSGGLEIDTKRTVVLRSVGTYTIQCTSRSQGGEVYLEDVVGDDFRFRKQNVWARQLNIENEGTHLTNDGGNLWVLGYKTERGGTLIHTLGGGRTEILGGFSYTTTAGKLAPMIVNDNSSVWSFFGEICFNGDPFSVRIQETRGKETKRLGQDEAHTIPYSGYPAAPSKQPR
jgi:hypothetical protein